MTGIKKMRKIRMQKIVEKSANLAGQQVNMKEKEEVLKSKTSGDC
jgi:hypothetical protein